jgi:class 3 adenylate cyclase
MSKIKKASIVEFCKSCESEAGSTGMLLHEYIGSLAIIEDDNIQKRLLKELIKKYVALEKRVDGLLKNTLPGEVAEEIKYHWAYPPRSCECTILFTDIVGFTHLAERMSGEHLVDTLDKIFKKFDDIVNSFRGTKIKTIGDAYMAVFGAPHAYDDHAVMAIRSALAFLRFLDQFNGDSNQHFQMRIGIHTGKVIAGVVGKERMQFDVFGDHVNITSRFESSGIPGRINVSEAAYRKAQGSFVFEERGEITLKNKANMKAYLVVKEV